MNSERKNKIFAFGCSQTFGHGLADCYREENEFYHAGEEPSKFAFPQLIGDALGKEVINLSRPGASNKLILQQIKTHQSEINKDDIVIIHWTYIERHAVFVNDEKDYYQRFDRYSHNHLNLKSNNTDKVSKLYYKHIYRDSDACIVTRWYMNYAHLTLKAQGVKSIHCPPLMNTHNNKSLIYGHSWHDHNFVNDPYFESDISFVSKMVQHDDIQVDRAVDGRHAGPKTHRNFADLILKEFF
jgi:hypothetical protein